MKNGIKLIAALSMAIAAMLGTSVITGQVNAQVVSACAATDCGCAQPNCTSCQSECGCGQSACSGGCRRAPAPRIFNVAAGRIGGLTSSIGQRSGRIGSRRACGTCQTDCGCVQCPSCEGDVCKLELDQGKQKKTCFKVEQKIVCIPPVRLPWQKCCPPGVSRKTRTINVLKKHTYECPSCSYKWSLQDPEVAKPVTAPSTPDNYVPPIVSPQQADWYLPGSSATPSGSVQGTLVPGSGK